MNESAELTILQTPIRADLVFVPGGAETILTSIEQRAREQAAALDVTKPKDRDGFGSLRFKVRRLKAELDRTGKDLKDEYQAKINQIDAERRTIRERMEALEVEVYKPLADFKAMEAARVEGHTTALALVEAWGAIDPVWSAAEIAERMEVYGKSDLLTRDWQEFHDKAQTAARNAFNALKVAKVDAAERKAAAVEAERLQAEEVERQRIEAARIQAAREATIAAEAAEAARVEAERRAAEEAAHEARRVATEHQRLVDEAREAAERAEAERLRVVQETERRRVATEKAAQQERDAAALREHAAIARAEKAERERIEAARQAEERRIAAVHQAKVDRLAAVETERRRVQEAQDAAERAQRKREQDVAHKRKINREAVADLVGVGLTEEQSQAVVTALAKGAVRHCRVEY